MGTSVAYDYYPYAATEFPDKREFLELAVEEYGNNPCLVCTRDDTFLGILVLNPLSKNIHIRGLGRGILSAIVVPNEPGIFNLLLNKLRHLVQQEGGSWYTVPRRAGKTTTVDHYRRLHGQSS